MRILHVVGLSLRRGAELVALELSYELDELDHENSIVAICHAQDGSTDPTLPPLVAKSQLGLPVVLIAAVRLRRLLRSSPFDVVLAHGGWPVQVAALGVPRTGPLVVWQRILGLADKVWAPPRSWWWHRLVRRVDAVVALTDDNVAEMRRFGFGGPVWTIPNARRPDRFESLDRVAEQAWLRDEIGVGPDVELIGFVGHMVRQKRPERAVEVLKGLHERGRSVHLVIAGGGPLADLVRRRVRELDLDGQVTLLGHRHDVERILAGVDVTLITSDDEGIPGVSIEAQMAGCPVVTFPVGSVGDVVEHGVTGIVLAGHDVDAMAEAAADLLGNPARREQMGQLGRARTPDFSSARTARIYSERLGSLPHRKQS